MAASSNALEKPTNFQAWWNRTSKTRIIYTYLFPSLLVMAMITFYPLLYQVWMSFTDFGIKNLNQVKYTPPNYVGFQNYLDIFSGSLSSKIPNFSFWKLLAFNLVWTFSNVIVHVIAGVLIAVLLDADGLKGKSTYRTIFILPMVIPSLVIAVVWRNMFDPTVGSINTALASIGGLFGVPASAFNIRWMEQIEYPIPFIPLPLSFFAVLIANIWLGWPFMTMVATGALQSIPRDLYEAASIDGATPIQQFFNITVPMIRPAMIPAMMYGLIATFNQFNVIFFISQGGPLRKTEILVTTAFRLVNEQRLYGMAAAFSILIFFVLFSLTLATNRVTKATESYDA